MSSISILHLSDIHFRKKEKEGHQYRQLDIEEKLLKTIAEHVKKNGQPDIVAITGDIAFDGKEYKKAETFFENLRAVLPNSLYLPVPGNHDVDRGNLNLFFSLQKNIIQDDKVNAYLESQEQVTQFILPKFRTYRAFSDKVSPGLYDSKNDYFWVKNLDDKKISFLGLNSVWACEGDEDRFNIALGYPQIKEAQERAMGMDYKILLMHHPPVNWLKDFDNGRAGKEVFKSCDLILCGHSHFDQALHYQEPGQSCICLSAKASYTAGEKGYLGFQFLEVEFEEIGTKVKVWPYFYDDKSLLKFLPHLQRYNGQGNKPFYELSTVAHENKPKLPEPVDLKIPGDYRDWIRMYYPLLI